MQEYESGTAGSEITAATIERHQRHARQHDEMDRRHDALAAVQDRLHQGLAGLRRAVEDEK